MVIVRVIDALKYVTVKVTHQVQSLISFLLKKEFCFPSMKVSLS